MTILTQRALRVFAVLEHYRAGSPDILDALLPFFEPILAEFNGRTLDQEAFAERIREAYRWNFTADIVEELIPRFESRKWVHEFSKANDVAAYRVAYENPIASPAAEGEIKIGQVLLNAAQELKLFIDAISPLTSFSKSINEMSDILVEWLVSIDAYSEDVLRQKAIQTTYVEGQLGLAINLTDSSSLTSEERYICARFVKHLFQKKSPLVGDLCKLASVGLLTEVIQDFQKPLTKVNKTNLNIYLDAPVALDLLGVSGKAAAANVRPIIAKLQAIGATVRVFRVSVDELQHALDAVLRRSPTDRTGPTADAMRRNEVAEAYVRQVAGDPDTALAALGVKIIARKLDQFPNEHEYFTREQYERLFGKMTWHLEMSRREHDTTIIAHIVRMRGGTQSRDIFQTRHLLITRNGALAQLARKFCVDEEISPRHSIGPAIHQRQLATAAWLRTGLGDDSAEVPRSYLLAACERVLELKKNIVEQVKYAARNLTPEKAEQLELLLTQDRSVQVLMDKTLGASNVVSSTNIESLVDAMKRTLTDTIEKDADERITSAQREAASKIRKAHEARRAAERDVASATNTLNTVDREDREVIGRLLENANTASRRHRAVVKGIVGLLCVVIGALPLLTETIDGFWKIFALCSSGLLGSTFAFFQLLDRPTGLSTLTDRYAHKKLERMAAERGITSKLRRFKIGYVNGEFTIRGHS